MNSLKKKVLHLASSFVKAWDYSHAEAIVGHCGGRTAFVETSERRWRGSSVRFSCSILCLLTFLGLGIVSLPSCQSAEKKEAEQELANTLHSAPFSGLTDSINRFPDNPSLYLKRAILLSQNNLHELATPDYKKAWETTNDEGTALQYTSNLLLTGNLPMAIDLLSEGAKMFPDNT